MYILPITQTWKIPKTHSQDISSQAGARGGLGLRGLKLIFIIFHNWLISKYLTNFIYTEVNCNMLA